MLDEGICVLERYAEDVCPLVARYYFMLVLWVKFLEQFKRRSCKFAYLFKVKHLLDLECIDNRRHLGRLWLQSMFLIIFCCI